MTQYLSVETLASRLELNPGTVRKWVFERRIPFVKLGRCVRFDEAEITRWMSKAIKPSLR